MEFSGAGDRLEIKVENSAQEFVSVQTRFQVDRWDEDQTRWAQRRLELPDDATVHKYLFEEADVAPYKTTVDENCNLITLTGWNCLLVGIAGTPITNRFSASFGRIGAGTATTTPTASDTKLTADSGNGSTTSYYQIVSQAPTINTGSPPCSLVLTSTFAGTTANFNWQEFGTDNFNASGPTTQGLGASTFFINHGLSAQGVKSSGQTWTATETISFGFPNGVGLVN